MNPRIHSFRGDIQKIRVVSNGQGYGPYPEPDEEVEQRLTISKTGRVWLTRYNYGNHETGSPVLGSSFRFSTGRETAGRILDAVSKYFSRGYIKVFATDIGCWDMTITNMEGKNFRYEGSLCGRFEVDGIDLSDLIRDSLKMPDLYVFDGRSCGE